MLYEIMNYLNNFFVDTYESGYYKIVSDGIEGTFSNNYYEGQYITLDGTYLNDGVYKISSVSLSKITVEETLTGEDTEELYYLYGQKIPKSFITLATEIETYNTNSTDGIKSESQGNRSISYLDDSTWSSVFSKRLSQYRRIFSDKCRR